MLEVLALELCALIDNQAFGTHLFYGPEKTLADGFKFRNRIGLDVVLEALRSYRSHRNARLQEVLHYARICRVEKVLRPILEALA